MATAAGRRSVFPMLLIHFLPFIPHERGQLTINPASRRCSSWPTVPAGFSQAGLAT
jgi:hypothetical protein